MYTQFSAAACKSAFESLAGLDTVNCQRTAVSTYGTATYTVELVTFPDNPYQNNVFRHDGAPELPYFACDYSGVTGTGVSCSVVDVQNDSIRGE